MFYVGAVLIADGRYDFGKMIEVFTLIIFSITFSAQIMTYRKFLVSPSTSDAWLMILYYTNLSPNNGQIDSRGQRLLSLPRSRI